MAGLRLGEMAARMGGRLLRGSPEILPRRCAIDSRQIGDGDLFFAILGERDGHDFVADAFARGAAAAVVKRDVPSAPADAALVVVDDPQTALQRLAGSVLQTSGARVIGITGSIGKTTTKEFTHALLSRERPALKSRGNFNNQLGLPLSLLDLTPGLEWAVLEYGANHPGEIAALCRIAPPDVAVITNVNPVHLEFLLDLEGVAHAKRELLEGMKPGGTAVLNRDDPLVGKMSAPAAARTVTFGLDPAADISLEKIDRMGWEGIRFDLRYGDERLPVFLPFFNDGFLYNFLAAAAALYAAGLGGEAVAAGSRLLEAFSNRGNVLCLPKGIRVVDDSYNSSPAALELALKALAGLPGGRRIAVLGDMLELGNTAGEYHRSAGKRVAELGFDLLITVGPLARRMAEGARASGMPAGNVLSADNSEQAAGIIPPLLRADDVILVKGSRGVRTERIVDEITGRG